MPDSARQLARLRTELSALGVDPTCLKTGAALRAAIAEATAARDGPLKAVGSMKVDELKSSSAEHTYYASASGATQRPSRIGRIPSCQKRVADLT